MERKDLIKHKENLINIKKLILNSLNDAVDKNEIHRLALSLYDVNRKIKIIDQKLGKNPLKEVKTSDPLIRWINGAKENKKSR